MHQRDGAGVVVAGPHLDHAVALHRGHQLAADIGAHDRERPVVERADAAGGDVGVLGREVGAHLAALARPRVAFLQRYLVVRAVLHPDLEHALDVHLLHVGLLQAVLRFEQLLEDRVVERLRAQQADVEEKRRATLPALRCFIAGGDDDWHDMPDQRDALFGLLEILVRHRVRRVRVAAAGRRDHLFTRARDAGDRLPRGAVAFEVGHERGVDDVVLERVHEDRGDETAVLADLEQLRIGGTREDDVLADAGDLVGVAGAAEEELVDLGLPRAKAWAGARARRARLVAVAAVAPGRRSRARSAPACRRRGGRRSRGRRGGTR